MLLAVLILPQLVMAQSKVQLSPPSLPSVTPLIPTSFILRSVRLEGSTVLTQEEINEIVTTYLGKAVTFEELLTIQTSLTERYVQAGYVTSLVVLPEQENQNLESGTVTYRALEGELESLQVNGLNHLRESYVRSHLLPYASTPLNVNKIEEGLLLLRDNPLFSSLNSTLIPGTSPGKNQWIVTFLAFHMNLQLVKYVL